MSAEDVLRVAGELFRDGNLAGTVLGPLNGWKYPADRLKLS
ncbi:MAG TPA: hypothetical protein VK911_01915 [Vicinamibacterales bacterium]|nr:hypothetical protein [Vicinamibacterales bacterium]